MVAQVRRNDGLLLGSTQRGLISRGTHTHTQMQVTLDLLLFFVSLAADGAPIVILSFTGIMRTNGVTKLYGVTTWELQD